MIDTMLATWGLSLLLIGLVTLIFGNTAVSVPAPIPGYQIGHYQMGGYNLFIIAVAAILMMRDVACASLHAHRPDGARRDAGAPTSSRRSATTRIRSTC